MKTKIFANFEQFEAWTETFDDCEHQYIPTIIDDGWKISVDITTKCKTWKTALNRFEKAFAEYDDSIKDWAQGMRESCEAGYFKDVTLPSWCTTEEELKEFNEFGVYSWGVEEIDDGEWYIFLNISGNYANRQKVA